MLNQYIVYSDLPITPLSHNPPPGARVVTTFVVTAETAEQACENIARHYGSTGSFLVEPGDGPTAGLRRIYVTLDAHELT